MIKERIDKTLEGGDEIRILINHLWTVPVNESVTLEKGNPPIKKEIANKEKGNI